MPSSSGSFRRNRVAPVRDTRLPLRVRRKQNQGTQPTCLHENVGNNLGSTSSSRIKRSKVKKRIWQLAILIAFIPAIALAAWRQDSGSHGSMALAKPDWSELMRRMHKMDAAMASVEPSGDGDVDFVKLLLPHHEAAIDMARAQLLYGGDPQMRGLAQEIITDQQSDIELMKLWLKQRGPSPQ